MVKSPKQKGTGKERQTAKLLTDAGIPSERVPGSGAFAGLPGDVIAKMMQIGLHRNWQIEVKVRAKPIATLEKWLAGNDVVFRWTDYDMNPLVCMHWDVFSELLELVTAKEAGDDS